MIVIDMPEDRPSQAALIVDGRLEDLLIDPPRGDTTPKPGEIFWAKVDRVTQGGAFVKLTPEHQGFLRETKGVKQGEGVLVQTTSYAEPGKAIPATTRLLYKGRYVIHTPSAPGTNVSRQIKDPEERERLERSISDWLPGQELGREPALTRYRNMHRVGGYIVRSAAKAAAAQDIHNDLQKVLARRSEREGLTRSTAPGTVPGSSLALEDALRDWDWDSQTTILASNSCQPFLHSDHPELAPRHEDCPFENFGIWDEIERLTSALADLPSGGWMALEATRAMVTVDVNTGDGFGTGDAMTANIEAARELPRQLRLRGLGGQIIIDFAPLKKQHRNKIEEELKRAFRKDPIDTTLAGWTPLGNFELQRKRERRPLSELL
ncbi:MAG: ribonuclease E/G [Pseudomonadota bacterium]